MLTRLNLFETQILWILCFLFFACDDSFDSTSYILYAVFLMLSESRRVGGEREKGCTVHERHQKAREPHPMC